MSILGTSRTAIRVLDMNIGNALGSLEAALILQQLHYWMKKQGVGVMEKNTKYIYNSFKDWVSQQFTFLTTWKFRQAMGILRSLGIVQVIRYKSKQWNQTNYYNLNYERLREWAEAENIEIIEMWSTTPQGDESQTLEIENPKLSFNESKSTAKKETTKQSGDRLSNESESIAAADLKKGLEGEKGQTDRNPHSAKLTALNSQRTVKSRATQLNLTEEKSSARIDCIVNKNWKSLIQVLDGAGIPINKTLKDLLKMYPAEKVESAIAIVKSRKREQHIPNLSGYFVSALKGDWSSQSLVAEEGENQEVDRGSIFRHWYDLAKSLGYCSGQEVRDGEQFVCLSGSWEKWQSAVERGYSLSYLKKIMSRNQGK